MSSPFCELKINLGAIASNWRKLSKLSASAECAAVVKADAYGLGVSRVAPSLYGAGCRVFFVATVAEGQQLVSLIPDDSRVFILSGIYPGEEQACIDAGLIPVLLSLDMLLRWKSCHGSRDALAALKIDTGMGRLGFSAEDYRQLLLSPNLLEGVNICLVLSHLACADEPRHLLNQNQLQRFAQIKSDLASRLPKARFSLANSAGLALGDEFYFDILRPGIALYGGQASVGKLIELDHTVELQLKIIQTRRLVKGSSVGYGATKIFDRERLIATAAGGYADGIFRSLSNSGCGYCEGFRVPIVGRVSMDSTMFDITDVNNPAASYIELLGAHQSIDGLARDANTISYELLTSLGERFKRTYIDA